MLHTSPPPPPNAAATAVPAQGGGPADDRIVDSATLLQGGRSILIRHGGELYRLQATRQGKLILTK